MCVRDWVTKICISMYVYVIRFCKPFVCIIPTVPTKLHVKPHNFHTNMSLFHIYQVSQWFANVYTCPKSRALYLKFWLEKIRRRTRKKEKELAWYVFFQWKSMRIKKIIVITTTKHTTLLKYVRSHVCWWINQTQSIVEYNYKQFYFVSDFGRKTKIESDIVY